jgi:DNA primase large subunit
MAVHRTAPDLDERALFAEYPFLPGAEALLAGESISVRGLLEEPAYESVRALGRARILAAADDPRGTRDLDELARAPAEVRFLSFLFARMVLSATPAGATLRRWAVAEAKRSYARLREVPVDELSEVARRLGFTFGPSGGSVAVPLVDYVKLAVPIREAEFRLASQSVRAGEVIVRPVRAARLLQEAVRLRLAESVPLAREVTDLIGTRERELLEEVARRMPAPRARAGGPGGPIRPELFPPCIRKMMRTLQQGENLSHAGRFALAAFLHRTGADFETIVDAYRGAPDFDESITRYQVEHITHRDGGAGYEPPECDTVRSHGLCLREGDPTAAAPKDRERDERCFDPTLRHPLQYYRRRGGTVVERAEDPARTEATITSSGGGPGRPGARGRSRSTARPR